MFTRKALVFSFGRAAALTTVAALALTAFEPSMAQAGTPAPAKGVSATSGAAFAIGLQATEVVLGAGLGAVFLVFEGLSFAELRRTAPATRLRPQEAEELDLAYAA